MFQAFLNQVDSIHGSRIVDVIGGDERSIERTGPGCVEELPGKIVLLTFPVKDALDPEILRADVGAQVLPFRIFRVGRWTNRIWTYMAKATGHAHAVGPYQVLIVVIRGVSVELDGIPFL